MTALIAALAALAGAADDAPEGPPPVRLTLRPAAAPLPALRYKLLPEVREQEPGNALLLYYKAFSPEWANAYRDSRGADLMRVALEAPLDKLRADPAGARTVLNPSLLDTLDRAARRAHADWELTPSLRREGVALVLPDAQAMRSLGVLLAVRARYEAADGRFDQSVSGLATGFALARHLGEAPTIIHSLIGAAVATLMLNQLEELIGRPGAPNLYWALSDLPTPLLDLRKAYQGERMWIDWLAPGVREKVANPSAPPMSPEELQGVADRLARLESTPPPAGSRLALAALAAQRYPAAREWLASRGWTPAQIDAIPVTQAALMVEVFDYDCRFDEAAKWHSQPAPLALAGLAAADRRAEPSPSLARLLLPATQSAYRATLRLDRRVAALRCVEALRLHAAAHGGKLPASLGEVTEVPVPADPATGKPFEYARTAGGATLAAPPTPAMPWPAFALRYELTPAE